jgi:hypothetical protein
MTAQSSPGPVSCSCGCHGLAQWLAESLRWRCTACKHRASLPYTRPTRIGAVVVCSECERPATIWRGGIEPRCDLHRS